MFYVIVYLVAIVLANSLFAMVLNPTAGFTNGQQLLADFGICFAFIGLDMGLRDRLHDTWRGNQLFAKMTGLILAGSVISYAMNYWLNVEATDIVFRIALASFLAFGASSFVDFLIYHKLRDKPAIIRLNGSNIPSALVDSLVFPLVAFGWPLLWEFFAVEFVAKVLGGLLWGLLLIKLRFISDK